MRKEHPSTAHVFLGFICAIACVYVAGRCGRRTTANQPTKPTIRRLWATTHELAYLVRQVAHAAQPHTTHSDKRCTMPTKHAANWRSQSHPQPLPASGMHIDIHQCGQRANHHHTALPTCHRACSFTTFACTPAPHTPSRAHGSRTTRSRCMPLMASCWARLTRWTGVR